jgi:tetratricopeptide (TPR) repeat protein
MRRVTSTLVFCVASFLGYGALFAQSITDLIAQGDQASQLKNFTQARSFYQQAIQKDPRNAALRQKLGMTDYQLGQKDEALKEFRFSLALSPNNPQLSQFVQKMQYSTADAQNGADALGQKTTLPEVEGDDDSEEPAKPFVRHWTGALAATYSNQPSSLGGGQVQREIGFTGTYLMNETGTTNASIGVVAGRQIEEGADNTYAQLNLGGGIGFGFFQPSLQLQWQAGQAGLDAKNATLDLNFQLWGPFTIGLSESGGVAGHQGPVSQFITQSDKTVEIDTGNFTQSLVATFVPWDFLTLTLTSAYELEDTYQAKLLNAAKVLPLNQQETIPSVTLGADITFLKDFVLGLSYQKGEETYPAGTVYSPITGSTTTFSQSGSSTFTGYTASLTWNID